MPHDLRIQIAFQLLLQAHDYASELAADRWDFAVDFASLQEAGLTRNDLRWLLYKNLVVQAREVTDQLDDQRAFQRSGKVHLCETSCFILTELGAELARSVAKCGVANFNGANPAGKMGNGHVQNLPANAHTAPAKMNGELPKPIWDKDRRTLCFDTRLVKQFKVPAPNQEIILEAFSEEGWPIRIDDPLPLHSAIDPKRRLHDTINSLNRNQRVNLLRFTGDGSGQSICWEPLLASRPAQTSPP